MDRLLAIMARLRDPATGCPWDVEQTFATIAPHTIEEAYEVADAIARSDLTGLKEELGDLLLQIVFHALMAEEQGAFAFEDVVEAICDKLVRRHPHVFADGRIDSAEAQIRAWESHKETERATKARLAEADEGAASGALAGVALALPALLRAAKLQSRAAHVGFDWPDAAAALPKVGEELAELSAEMQRKAAGAPAASIRDRLEDEVGDLLFAVVNVARKLKIDPEGALRRANGKFERRFAGIEARLRAEDRTADDATLDELDRLWTEIKATE